MSPENHTKNRKKKIGQATLHESLLFYFVHVKKRKSTKTEKLIFLGPFSALAETLAFPSAFIITLSFAALRTLWFYGGAVSLDWRNQLTGWAKCHRVAVEPQSADRVSASFTHIFIFNFVMECFYLLIYWSLFLRVFFLIGSGGCLLLCFLFA